MWGVVGKLGKGDDKAGRGVAALLLGSSKVESSVAIKEGDGSRWKERHARMLRPCAHDMHVHGGTAPLPPLAARSFLAL